jgi:DNA-binding MarR family transcriptional regulator
MTGGSNDEFERRIGAVRSFNRFYTGHLGLLEERFLKSQFSLTKARVLYELCHHGPTTATEIAANLGLDPGYLSRIVADFERESIVRRVTSQIDRRQQRLTLTAKGQQTFARLERRSHDKIASMLADLSEGQQETMINSMQTIAALLDRRASSRV